jgi:acetyltransferase-like isoleucine patch superfamily enzyme
MLKRVAYELLMYVTNHLVARVPSHILRKIFYRTFLKLKIGRKSYIFMNAYFDTRGNFSLGNGSVINERCRIDNRGMLTIGNHVSISSDTHLITADHDVQSSDFVGRNRPIIIGDHVYIGSRATILPNVMLGRGCVVAAGAVVTKNVEPYTIVAGVPARKIGDRNRDLTYVTIYGRLFH